MPSRTGRSYVFSGPVLALSVAVRCLAGYEYQVTVIEGAGCGLFGPDWVEVEGLNELGHVTGTIKICDDTDGQAFIWTPEKGMIILDVVAGSTYSLGMALNDQDVVVGGWDGSTTSPSYTAMQWAGRLPVDLPPGPGGINGIAMAINGDGIVAGEWGNTWFGPYPVPCIWTDGGIVDLTSAFDAPVGSALSINDSGDVVGWRGTSWFFDEHACWLQADGTLVELGELPGGHTSRATDINAFHQICGLSKMSQSPVRYLGFVWQDGAFSVVEPLADYQSSMAYSVNDLGAVVGQCWTVSDTAVLWQNGVSLKLDTLIPRSMGVVTVAGIAINNRGQILCKGGNYSTAVGILLSPNEVVPGDIDIDSDVDTNDLSLFLQAWGLNLPWADVDRDGVVAGPDLGILLSNWTSAVSGR